MFTEEEQTMRRLVGKEPIGFNGVDGKPVIVVGIIRTHPAELEGKQHLHERNYEMRYKNSPNGRKIRSTSISLADAKAMLGE